MKSKAALFLLLAFSCTTLLAQDGGQGGRGGGRGEGRGGGGGRGGQPAVTPEMNKVTPEIPGVVKAGTKIEIVKYGLRGSDAGVSMPDGSVLVSANGGVIKVDPDGNVTTLVENSDQGAGLAIDPQGRVVAAQYSKRVSVIYPADKAELLTDSYNGKPYIRPNDLVIDKKGGIYFTDCYQVGAKPSPDDLPQAVYYIAPNSKKVMQVATDVKRPNGITLSPNEKVLYVNDWDSDNLVSYDIKSDGTLKNRKNFGKFDTKQETDHGLVSGADGLCIDSSGNTYATTPAGVQVFNKKGVHLGNIDAPYEMPPQNCGFGGTGKGYLYVTGRGVVWRVKTLTTGFKDRSK